MNEPLRAIPLNGGEHKPPETPKSERTKPRSDRALPTDRMKFQVQVDVLKGYANASGQGRHAITSDDLEGYVSVTPATAGLNNNFLYSSGLLMRESRGRYLPAPEVIEFTREASFKAAGAGKLLGPLMAKTWYYDAVRNRLELGPAPRLQVVQCLARAAGAQAAHTPQLEVLIEWLAFAGLILADGDSIRLAVVEPAVSETPSAETEEKVDQPVNDQLPPPVVEQPQQRVVLAFHLELTADDLAMIPAEQIAALFSAVGQVMATKNAAT